MTVWRDSDLVIDQRFCGPPHSANGGYAGAKVAEGIDGPAEVTLRLPPPLGRPLRIAQRPPTIVLLDEDGALLAEARPTQLSVDVPAPVSVAAATRAASHYPWRDRHPYPTCFVCGPSRDSDDGLQIFPGPVDGQALYAAPWTPAASLANGEGEVRGEFAWAALDCPSGIVTDRLGDVGQILLGRLAVEIIGPIVAGRPHVVQAWTLQRDGRKLTTASAIFSGDGELCGVGRAIWIELAPGPGTCPSASSFSRHSAVHSPTQAARAAGAPLRAAPVLPCPSPIGACP